MSEGVHLCRDCVFADRRSGPARDTSWICLHPDSIETPPHSLVTGEQPPSFRLTCAAARDLPWNRGCARAGRFWEPREEKAA